MNEYSTVLSTLETLTLDELELLAEEVQNRIAKLRHSQKALIKIPGIDLRVTDDQVLVTSPYLPEFVTGARRLNGKFVGDVWKFDRRDEQTVRSLMVETYGTDGSPVEVGDVEMDIYASGNGSEKQLFAFGREIANRPARDERVRLGNNVVIRTGDFGPSAGSRANPRLLQNGVVTVLVRDVPQILIDLDGTE